MKNAAVVQRRGGENLLKGWSQAEFVGVAHRKAQGRKVLRGGDRGAGDRGGGNFLDDPSERATGDFQDVSAASGGVEAQIRSSERCAGNRAESSGRKRRAVQGKACKVDAFAQGLRRVPHRSGVDGSLSLAGAGEGEGKEGGCDAGFHDL